MGWVEHVQGSLSSSVRLGESSQFGVAMPRTHVARPGPKLGLEETPQYIAMTLDPNPEESCVPWSNVLLPRDVTY